MNTAERVIEKFGGTRPMSEKTGIPATTIQSWKEGGRIPSKRQGEILAAAARHGISLGAADLISREAA